MSSEQFENAIVCVMEAVLHANGYVHRTITWTNIVYTPVDDIYILIDFDSVGRLCRSEEPCTLEYHDKDCVPNGEIDAERVIMLFGPEKWEPIKDKYLRIVNFAKKFRHKEKLSGEQRKLIKNFFWEFYEQNGEFYLINSFFRFI